jgi:NDP-sugar pyrophosphorylase family protein
MDDRNWIRGIILAGSWEESSFEALLPRPLVPVALTPLISHVFGWLRDGGIARATVCANGASKPIREFVESASGESLAVAFHQDETPRGPAGAARDAALASEGRLFVICDASTIPVVEIPDLLETHVRARAAVTLVVHGDVAASPYESRPWTPGDIYIFDRRVFDHVAPNGFQDIKESLIPKLHAMGEGVVTHFVPGACPRVLNTESYLSVNAWMVEQVAAWKYTKRSSLGEYRVLGQGLRHPTASIDPSARVIGPVLLGPEVFVGPGATIVGPTSVGPNTRIEADAALSRSVAWSHCSIGAGALVDRSLLVNDAVVKPAETVYGTVRHAVRSRWSQAQRILQSAAPGGTTPNVALKHVEA